MSAPGPTLCSNGHELNVENLRNRTGTRHREGDRAGHRECLACYRASAHRPRVGLPNDPAANQIRNIRKRAARLGYKVAKQGDELTITNRGVVVFAGTAVQGEYWVAQAYIPLPPGPAPQSISESWGPYVALYIREQQAAKRRPSTVQLRVNHLMMFARCRPDLTPLTVKRDDLIEYFSDNDWSPRTAHSFRSTFRVFFRLLCDLGSRSDDPALTLPGVKIPRSLPRPCPDHVVVEAFRNARDPRVRLALKIAVETGMRRFEIARVRATDVEGRQGAYTLHVIGKGDNERVIPVSDDLAGQLLALTTDYVFEGAEGEHLTEEHLGVLMARALPGEWTAHALRHRFATLAYQATGDLRAVQELLGHASPATTAIYTKVSDSAMRRAAMAAALDSANVPQITEKTQLKNRA